MPSPAPSHRPAAIPGTTADKTPAKPPRSAPAEPRKPLNAVTDLDTAGSAFRNGAATFRMRRLEPCIALALAGAAAWVNLFHPQAAYTVHELQLETGTVVREFASASGQVFALAWRGPVLPDLNQWLGSYFGAFKQEADQQRLAGRRGAPINLAQAGLVVRSNGRMRNFFGHAYVPALVPPTVNINEVFQDAPQ